MKTNRTTQHLNTWNDTPTKQAILDFVTAVMDQRGSQFVTPTESIAVIDNDGTL